MFHFSFQFIFIGHFILFFCILALASFFLVRSPKSSVHTLISYMFLSIASWLISSTLADISTDTFTALFWSRTALATAFFCIAFLLHFSFVFPSVSPKLSRNKLLLIYIPIIFPLLFTYTDYNIYSTSFSASGLGIDFITGPLYHILNIYIFTYFFISLHNFYSKYVSLAKKSPERLQILYFLFGLSLIMIFGVITNSILPTYFNYTETAVFGPMFGSLFFVLFSSIAILRYRFLDIMLLLKRKSFQFILAILAFILTLYAILWILYTGNLSSFLFLFEKDFTFLDVILLVTCILNLFLGIFVLKQNIRSRVHIIFFFIGLSLSMWCFGIFMTYVVSPFSDYFLFWNNFAFLGPYLLPTLFVFLSFTFPKVINLSTIEKSLLFLGLLFFLFSPFSVLEINGSQKILHSWFVSFIFPPYVLSFVIWALINFAKSYKKSQPPQKRQIFYVFLAFFFILIPAPITNLILPTFFNDLSLNQLGPASSLLFFIVLTFAMFRYRLLDAIILIKRSFLPFLVYLSFFALFAYLITLQDISWYAQPFILLLAILFFDKLRKVIQRFVDTFFPYKDIDLVDTFSKVQKTPSQIERLGDNMPHIIQQVCNEFQAESGVLFIKDSLKNVELSAMHPTKHFLSRAHYDHLFRFFTEKTRVLIIENVKDRDEKSYTILKNLGAEVVMTIRYPNSFNGILILGKRKGGWDDASKNEFLSYQETLQDRLHNLITSDRIVLEAYNEYMGIK